jgi:hypothetical protein
VGHRLWKNLKKNGLLIFLTWATALLSLVKGSAPEGVGNWNREGLGCACGIVPEEEPLFPSAVY